LTRETPPFFLFSLFPLFHGRKKFSKFTSIAGLTVLNRIARLLRKFGEAGQRVGAWIDPFIQGGWAEIFFTPFEEGPRDEEVSADRGGGGPSCPGG
jgi:hypothetical protein